MKEEHNEFNSAYSIFFVNQIFDKLCKYSKRIFFPSNTNDDVENSHF